MIQDTFYTLTPINRILRIFVLSDVKRDKGILVESWSLTENFIVLSSMTVINVFLLYNKIIAFEMYNNGHASLKFLESFQLTYLFGFAEYILDLVFVFKCRKTSLKYLQFYSDIDKILGAPDFKAIHSKNLRAVLNLVSSYFVTTLVDMGFWIIGYGIASATLYSVDYAYNFINALTVLDLVSNVTQIEYRLKVMIRQIEEFYSTSPSVSGIEDHHALQPVKKINRLNIVVHNKNMSIMLLSNCYILLNEQVNYINKAFGIRVGAFCLVLIFNLTYLINVIIRFTLGLVSIPSQAQPKLTAFSTALRITNYTAVVLILVRRCQQTYTQCDNIVRLVDLTLLNKKISVELKTALQELRGLVISRPVRFHGDHFFFIDCPLLVSIASVVVTYTIIMLQSMS